MDAFIVAHRAELPKKQLKNTECVNIFQKKTYVAIIISEEVPFPTKNAIQKCEENLSWDEYMDEVPKRLRFVCFNGAVFKVYWCSATNADIVLQPFLSNSVQPGIGSFARMWFFVQETNWIPSHIEQFLQRYGHKTCQFVMHSDRNLLIPTMLENLPLLEEFIWQVIEPEEPPQPTLADIRALSCGRQIGNCYVFLEGYLPSSACNNVVSDFVQVRYSNWDSHSQIMYGFPQRPKL